ncbi:hypothetical protein D6D01_00192 [Aureobasidium pullulans]|uniref:Uncharacterized protein n=1 Tax=Aureobasidium pullulans TaxID=5580 RepID=A0A4S9M2L2_AURPU|nr:hypothetical protein D6D01_00192 [Aureobasidium pullulans]
MFWLLLMRLQEDASTSCSQSHASTSPAFYLGFRMMIWSKNVSEFERERKGLEGPSADAEWSSNRLENTSGAISLKYPGIGEAHAHLA